MLNTKGNTGQYFLTVNNFEVKLKFLEIFCSSCTINIYLLFKINSRLLGNLLSGNKIFFFLNKVNFKGMLFLGMDKCLKINKKDLQF